MHLLLRKIYAFTDAEAVFVSEDEPEDCVEEESDYDDEIEILNYTDYTELDVAAAITLEEELIGGPSTQPRDSLIVQGEDRPRRRGRPRINPEQKFIVLIRSKQKY